MNREIALQVQNETLLQNWHFYLILLLITIVGSYLASLLKGAGAQKGKFLAIESSLNTIKKQVELTTETSESIKSAIGHDLWRKKELESIKREKLEEYFLVISSLNYSLNNEMISKLFGADVDYDPHCFDKANMIQSLYLPELAEEHFELCKAVQNYTRWVSDGLFMIAEQAASGIPNPKPTKEFMEQQPKLLQALTKPTAAVILKAKEVAQAVNT
ncbi:hypothetical protein ACJJIF_21285 [Microbulbifer sp. SSSA002]|uniref:hypothetical protein n=1 Tax=Microbulbifer sp. SSSA002 TaxID=3243376 RepID=UPI0040393CC6